MKNDFRPFTKIPLCQKLLCTSFACINTCFCDLSPFSTLFSSFLTVLLSVCVLFLSGGASVILSLGLASWCDTVTDHSMRPYRYNYTYIWAHWDNPEVHFFAIVVFRVLEWVIRRNIIDCIVLYNQTLYFPPFLFHPKLCRVSVCCLVSGRGHFIFLHRTQPGRGKSSHFSLLH